MEDLGILIGISMNTFGDLGEFMSSRTLVSSESKLEIILSKNAYHDSTRRSNIDSMNKQ